MTTTPSRADFLVFGAPLFRQPEMDAVHECMQSGWLGTGQRVARFERAFAAYTQARHAVAVNSSAAALHLSLLAAGLKPGDEVITSPLAFCATVNAIVHTGATPVLADVDPHSMNLDPARVRECITPDTRAIVAMHLGGRPCDMTALLAIAREHNLILIEDCSDAIEAKHHGRPVGSLGDFGCFSFFSTRSICTGEGGMVTTRTREHADRIRTLALHGFGPDAWTRYSDSYPRQHLVTEPGYQYNMVDLQAAIGLHQLARIEQNWVRKRAIWHTYQQQLSELPLTLPAETEPGTRHAYHLFTVRINEQRFGMTRDDFLNAMHERRIGVYAQHLSIAEHPFYQQRFGWQPEQWPNAMRIGRETVSLPAGARLTDQDVRDVVQSVEAVAAEVAGAQPVSKAA